MIRLILIAALLTTLAIPALAKDDRGVAVRPVAPTGETVKGEQWLLTIGIDTYISWPRLKTAVNDAKALRSILMERYTSALMMRIIITKRLKQYSLMKLKLCPVITLAWPTLK